MGGIAGGVIEAIEQAFGTCSIIRFNENRF